jgi:hypothetical protein
MVLLLNDLLFFGLFLNNGLLFCGFLGLSLSQDCFSCCFLLFAPLLLLLLPTAILFLFSDPLLTR